MKAGILWIVPITSSFFPDEKYASIGCYDTNNEGWGQTIYTSRIGPSHDGVQSTYYESNIAAKRHCIDLYIIALAPKAFAEWCDLSMSKLREIYRSCTCHSHYGVQGSYYKSDSAAKRHCAGSCIIAHNLEICISTLTEIKINKVVQYIIQHV